MALLTFLFNLQILHPLAVSSPQFGDKRQNRVAQVCSFANYHLPAFTISPRSSRNVCCISQAVLSQPSPHDDVSVRDPAQAALGCIASHHQPAPDYHGPAEQSAQRRAGTRATGQGARCSSSPRTAPAGRTRTDQLSRCAHCFLHCDWLERCARCGLVSFGLCCGWLCRGRVGGSGSGDWSEPCAKTAKSG